MSLKEKGKLIEESMRPGFNRKEIVARYGININTITNILKRKDEILQTLESGKLKVQSRVRLSLQEKAKLIIGRSSGLEFKGCQKQSGVLQDGSGWIQLILG